MKANKYLYVFLMMILCAGSVDVLANTARIEGEQFNGNRSWAGPHATFTISGGKTASTTVGADGRKLQLQDKLPCTIKWVVDENYSIEVNKIQTRIGSPNIWGYDLYFNEIKCGNVGGWSWKDNVYLDGLTLGNEDSITVRGTATCNLYYIEITYTITPNAPQLTVSEDSIFVAIEPENEEIDSLEIDSLNVDSLGIDSLSADSAVVKLIQEVYLPAKFVAREHLAIEIEMVENPNNMGVVTEDSVFYSTEVGTYTFRARYLAEEGCHNASEWSEIYTVYVLPIVEDEPEVIEGGDNEENQPGTTTGLGDIQSQSQAQKFLRGNILYIRRGDALFTIDGRRVE